MISTTREKIRRVIANVADCPFEWVTDDKLLRSDLGIGREIGFAEFSELEYELRKSGLHIPRDRRPRESQLGEIRVRHVYEFFELAAAPA